MFEINSLFYRRNQHDYCLIPVTFVVSVDQRLFKTIIISSFFLTDCILPNINKRCKTLIKLSLFLFFNCINITISFFFDTVRLLIAYL